MALIALMALQRVEFRILVVAPRGCEGRAWQSLTSYKVS